MSITAPAGFRAAGVTAGLKANGRPDLAVIVNDGPDHHGAAVFTSNRVEAAPVTWSRQVLADGRVDAVVLNSGGANACTGAAGCEDESHGVGASVNGGGNGFGSLQTADLDVHFDFSPDCFDSCGPQSAKGGPPLPY